jgi:cytochrome P450
MAHGRSDRRRARGSIPRSSHVNHEFRFSPYFLDSESPYISWTGLQAYVPWFVFEAITHALFDLASSPEYLHPLREEAEEVIKRAGWTKAAVDQMPKLDSFIKESQRLHPFAICKLTRK